jgi:hypothetical protein
MGLIELKNAFPFPANIPEVPPHDHGWFWEAHVELLSGAMGPHVNVILELGSWLGKSTRWFAEKSPNATIIAVDHWQGSAEHFEKPEWSTLLPTLYETFIKNCWAFRDRIIPLRMNTISGMGFVNQFGVNPDLIFIDAGHDYASAYGDVSNALRLFPNAALCGDDFYWAGVNRAVTEHVQQGSMCASYKENQWWKENNVFMHIQGTRQVPGK